MLRATRWYRQVVQNLRPSRRRTKARLCFESLEVREVPHVSGTVFVDLNQDGIQDFDDVGAANVTVKATDSAGLSATVQTDDEGIWEVELDSDNIRIEFSGFPENTMPGRQTETTGATVRFLDETSNRDGVDLALAAPMLVTSQFFYDDAVDGMNSSEGAVIAVPYGATEAVSPEVLATVDQVGSVWGLAYQPSSNSVYAASFVKRHSGLGPNAAGTGTTSGGIYRIIRTGDEAEVSLLVDVNTLGTGFLTGGDPHPSNPDGEETSADWFHDAATLPLVGKRGLGGMQISPDGRTLYVVNLNTRSLVEIPLSEDGSRDMSRRTKTTQIPLGNPSGSGITSFSGADLRPFAVAVRGNAVFVGVTYTAETSRIANTMRAFVYAYDPAIGAFRSYNQQTGTFTSAGSPAPVLTANLNYGRGVADDLTPDEPGDEVSANWMPWTSTFDTSRGNEGAPVHPSPWLTDIAFDGNAMVLAVRDRFGDQGGFQTGNTNTSNEDDFFSVIASGDVLRAAANSTGGWTLESGGTAGGVTSAGATNGQGPGGGEYYFQDNADPAPDDIAMGALAQVPGFRTIAMTGNDPGVPFAGGIYTLLNSDSGTGANRIGAGSVFSQTEIFASADESTFGSANGLGDLEFLPAVGTVQAGNRLFSDANGNGVQDAGEAGLSNVRLLLFQGNAQVDSVTSGTGGDFLFDNLRPNTPYQIRIELGQGILSGATLTQSNAGGNDVLDSDATLNGNVAVMDFTTGGEGTSDHTLDVGFKIGALAFSITLGDLVFQDVNANGVFDTGDTPIAGVTVELLDSTGTPVDGQRTTTDSNGLYSFTAVDDGTYSVRLVAENFDSGGALFNMTATTPNPDPDNDVDNDNNGGVSGTLGSSGFIVSGQIDLAEGAEPGSSNTNNTLDFGLVPNAATPTLTLGNLVWNDLDNDGTFDTGTESGISGVLVELLDGVGTPITGQTDTTDANGLYSFSGLAEGGYRVRLAASNFNTGGVLIGYLPSTPTVANPNTNIDNDNNGAIDGLVGSGVVVSQRIDLNFGQEPDTDGDTDTDTNLTLDFGMVAPATPSTLTLGNLVWNDLDNDGSFDTGTESGIPGVLVELLDSAGTPITGLTDTTDANGLYTFTGLEEGTYGVRLAASNFNTGGVLFGYTPSTTTVANPNTDINDDNNGSASGTLGSGGFVTSGQIVLALNGEPMTDGDSDMNTNLSLDFGLVAPAAPTTLTLGNLVWNDLDNDGTFDVGTESGVPGVLVELLDSAGTPITGQTDTTDANGLYSFTGLEEGTYSVRLAASNFNTGEVLFGYTSSATTSADPNDNTNDDDNGIANGQLGNGGVIVSGPITLTLNTEPTTDGDSDASTNLTLDFGVVAPTVTGLTLGNQVWNDLDNDGSFDIGTENGIPGVLLELLDSTGTPITGKTATTSDRGIYTFTDLDPGTYSVRLAASNFSTGAVLAGYESSTFTSDTVEDNTNNVDDGAVSGGTLGTGGFILAGPITLVANAEPTNDGDANANTNLTLDFGLFNAATTGVLSLGDAVWVDTDNDGTFDTTEFGIAGVLVELLDASGAPVPGRATTTDSAGIYTFVNIPAGNYMVRLAASNFISGGLLFNYTSSTFTESSADANQDDNDNGSASGTLGSGGFITSGAITLTAGQEPNTDGDTDTNTNLTLDFGVVAPVASTTMTVGSQVWNDTNNNGLLDNGETGLPGVAVHLVGPTGTVVQTTTTNATGDYRFTGIAAGDYRVRIAASNFSGAGILVGFTSSSGTNGSPTGAYEGGAVLDPDNNINNDDNGQVAGTLGQAGGSIETGLFTLASGTEPTNDGDTDSSTNLTIDLGVFRKFSIGNTVFTDTNNNGTQDTGESGITGVSIRLLDADNANALLTTTTTNSTGQYLFSALTDGNYIVEIAATNFNPGGPLFAFQSSTGGTGTPFEPAPSTAIDKQDHGTTTGVLGSGGTIRSGTVALGPTANAPTGETPSNDPTTPDNQSNLRIDFGVFQATPTTGSISGRVFLDYNNSGTFNGPDLGMQGVTITLSGGNLTAPITATTDADGNYRFSNLVAGTYSITETQPITPTNQNGRTIAGSAGGTTTTANTVSNIVLANNQQATNYLFTEIPIISTGGFVYEDANGNGVKNTGELGVSGVTVTLTGTSVLTGAITPITVTTGSDGAYNFPNLTPGTYTITETQPTGYIDGQETNGTPAATVSNDKFSNINLSTSSATSGGFNFGEVKTGGLGGVVYDDFNNNGSQDTGEEGIAGVSVRITGTNDRNQLIDRTVKTASNGAFSFPDLRPGTYRLVETQPKGYVDGTDKVGTAGGTANVTQNQITGINLTSSSAATGYLFGEQATADVVISQSPSTATVGVGGTVTMSFTVRNRGTADASDISILVNYGGMTFVSANTDDFDFDEDTREWDIGDLAPGETATVRLVLRALGGSSFAPSSRVSTSSDEISESNNSAASSIFAGVSAPVSGAFSSFWFLSSGTNARRSL